MKELQIANLIGTMRWWLRQYDLTRHNLPEQERVRKKAKSKGFELYTFDKRYSPSVEPNLTGIGVIYRDWDWATNKGFVIGVSMSDSSYYPTIRVKLDDKTYYHGEAMTRLQQYLMKK